MLALLFLGTFQLKQVFETCILPFFQRQHFSPQALFFPPCSLRRLALFRVQRSKMDMATIRENSLPRELVSNILSRLPARELLKCKCVCKSWFGLITDPHFVTNYYSFYNNNPTQCHSQEEHLLVICREHTINSLKTCISVLSWNWNEPKGLGSSEALILPDEFNSTHKYWSEIVGPCNGIYFLEGNPNVMMNPSLRQFKALPESHLADSNGPCYSLADYAGFGFDPKTNDYKVVALKDLWLKETYEGQRIKLVAELYSLNSNSWRKLDAALPLPLKIWGSSCFYTYVNNCCHWWGYVDVSGDRTRDVVLAFDMVNELFRKIKVPKIHSSSSGDYFTTLAPFNDSATIGVIVYPVSGAEKCFDIWVMKDYWDEGSWIKQYSVGPVPVIYKLVGFYENNRFFWKDNNERLVLYEPEYERARDLQAYEKYESIRAARYMESLVSLQRGNKSIHQCSSCSLVPDPLLNQRE